MKWLLNHGPRHAIQKALIAWSHEPKSTSYLHIITRKAILYSSRFFFLCELPPVELLESFGLKTLRFGSFHNPHTPLGVND